MKINQDVWRYINKNFSVIYHSVSGGKDSTYSLLNMLEEPYLRVPIFPLFNNTGLNCKTALKTIDKIKRFSPDKVCKGNVKHLQKFVELEAKVYLERTRFSNKKPIDVLKESFMNIPMVEKKIVEGKYTKKDFPCCYFLKDRPVIQFAKTTSKDALFTSSIRGGEGPNRQKWLAELRKVKEYFNFDVHLKRWKFYPCRDVNMKDVTQYLLSHYLFWDTVKSGCDRCPILVAWNLTNEGKRYERSIKFAEKLGV